jgi:HAD superfamily hydrolase (TIGR01509 family)
MVVSPARTPAALLWDVDGTLAETEDHGHRPAFNRAFAEVGLPWRWDSAIYHRLLGVSGGRERLAAFLREVEGAPPPARRLDDLFARKQRHYGEIVRGGGLPLRPGVARLIAEAAAAGIPQAIVTTSSRSAVEALAEGALGDLRHAFAFWICGEDVGRKKPDPEAYRLAIRRLPAAPGRMLALEDSRQGLAAAAAAGLPCLITLSAQSRQEPAGGFAAARAVLETLESDGAERSTVRRGPPCPDGRVTLSYLERLLASS